MDVRADVTESGAHLRCMPARGRGVGSGFGSDCVSNIEDATKLDLVVREYRPRLDGANELPAMVEGASSCLGIFRGILIFVDVLGRSLTRRRQIASPILIVRSVLAIGYFSLIAWTKGRATRLTEDRSSQMPWTVFLVGN
jgi:hypothetical protein